MYKLKQVAKRSSAFVGALTILAGVGSSAMPALASADALNPLTERSLTLSSSSPGWSYKDGSGNINYAPPNSGANGQKSGNFYSFKTSTPTTLIKAMTFQYCTTPAGTCLAPGNNGWTGGTVRNPDTTSTTDLSIHTSSPAQISPSNWTTILARHSTPLGVGGVYAQTPNQNDTEGNFIVLLNGTPTSDWTMTAGNLETGSPSTGDGTGAKNLITLVNSTGVTLTTSDRVEVKFFGTSGNYITNPGAGSFFVRLNDYNDSTDITPTTSTHIIDGGVTVANVMNESISIQTKVLETMDFSVGVKDPDTYNDTLLGTTLGLPVHGQCSALLMADPNGAGVTNNATYNAQPHNVLKLGNPSAEYSLRTDQAYTVDSYWRLSSNSSGGATVYYTGHTLTNTVGDEINPLTDAGTGTASNPGTEQFGLGMVQGGAANYLVTGDTYGSAAGDFGKYVTDQGDDTKSHLPRLAPLVPAAPYANAGAGTPAYAFNSDADTYTQPIATESTDVVNCVTAKMRYVANIAATTPAGVYTTKVNYVASPQY